MIQRFYIIINRSDLTFKEKVKVCSIGRKKITFMYFFMFECGLCYIYKSWDTIQKMVTENILRVCLIWSTTGFPSELLWWKRPQSKIILTSVKEGTLPPSKAFCLISYYSGSCMLIETEEVQRCKRPEGSQYLQELKILRDIYTLRILKWNFLVIDNKEYLFS